MCLVKSIAAVIVIGVLAVGALWFLQGPSGTWVVDRQAMREEGGEGVISRITDSLIPDLRVELTEDGKFTLNEGENSLFSGTWILEDSQVKFADSPLTTADYARPERLTVLIFEKTIIFKRQ